MPNDTGSEFDSVANNFSVYATTIRGCVRYRMAQRNLQPYLGEKPRHILDVGGGNGADAAWLVSQGHSVTLVEPSAGQLSIANRYFNFLLTDDERSRITVITGSLQALPLQDSMFDTVVIHGVAMFQEDPEAFIAAVIQWLQPGGLVSLMEKGYYGAEARTIREQDLNSLLQLQQTKTVVNHLGLTSAAFKPEDLERILDSAGITVDEWFGVRLITDDSPLKISDISDASLEAILAAEYAHGRNPNIKGQGQLLQFIGHKR